MRNILIYILFLTTLACYGTETKVTRVIDGDTFEIETGEKVRLIGINAPEISDIFGQEAKQYLSSLIANKTVTLERDAFSNDRDRYQRLLRYVIIGSEDINWQMIADGYAFAYLKYKFTKSNDYTQAQLTARENNKGIWGDSKKEIIIEQQKKKENLTLTELSPKYYFIGSLVLILLILGLYSYFRR